MAGLSIYLDWNATAPLRAEAFEAMRPFLEPGARQVFGNAASVHRHGQAAKVELERARRTCAGVLGCASEELVFTSGGTESNNLALRGLAWARKATAPEILYTRLEHAAVLETIEDLAKQGFVGVPLEVRPTGVADAGLMARSLGQRTALVTLQLVNNETGVIQTVAELGKAARALGIPFHVDAVQAPGKVPLRVDELCCATLALSAHKFEGPKGAGLLYVRSGTQLRAQVTGGGQEGGLRGGTDNVSGAAGMAEALRLAEAERVETVARLGKLREEFEAELKAGVPDAVIHGASVPRVPSTSFVSFPGCDGSTLVQALDAEGVSCSTGAACSEGMAKPSHVLEAMHVTKALAGSAVRFSYGRTTTVEELRKAAQLTAKVVKRMRGM